MKRPSNFDHMRHVGAKSPQARQLRKQIRQLELELTQGPAAALPERVDLLKLIIDRAALARIVRRNDALAEIDRWARDPAPAPLEPGDLVLAAAPGDWASRASWRVVACACDLCAVGRHVAVDQAFDGGWRHISRAALRRRGEPSRHVAEAWVNGIAFNGPVNRGLADAEAANPGTASLLASWLAEMAAIDVRGG